MPAIAMTRATVLVPVAEAMRHFNVPAEKLLRKRGLPALEIDDPAHWVPTHAVVMLAQDVEKIIGPEAFGGAFGGAQATAQAIPGAPVQWSEQRSVRVGPR